MAFRKKNRPLEREEKTYADDTLLVIATEDTYAPAQYFAAFPNQRIHIKVLPTLDKNSSPKAVFERILKFQEANDLHEFDQLWLSLDRDHWAERSHKRALAEVCKDCQQRGIEIAMSSPCFDLWLLQHIADVDTENPPQTGDAVAKQIREVNGEFNKKNIKPEHFPLDAVPLAISRAKALDTNPDDWFPESPCSRVYRIVEQAVEKDFIRLTLV